VIQTLIQAYPKAVKMQDKYGRTPLYHAVDKGAGMEALKILLAADPMQVTVPCSPKNNQRDVVTRSQAIRTPLFLAWASFLTEHRRTSTKKCVKKRSKKWDKATMLLEAYTRHTKGSKPFNLLYAVIELDQYLPEQVLSKVIKVCPQLLHQADPTTGRLPLGLAASTPAYSAKRSDEILKTLLQAAPEAAKERDKQGATALSAAVAAGKRSTTGVERLFTAAPDSVRWRDGRTGLPPALLAGTSPPETYVEHEEALQPSPHEMDPYNLLGGKHHELLRHRHRSREERSGRSQEIFEDPETEEAHLGTIYNLLRADPSQIHAWSATAQ
jgi:hypothetical protein